MANIRIKDQTTDTALAAGDYVIVDNETEGTRKFDLGQKLVDIDDDFTDVRSDLQDLQEEIEGGGTGMSEEFKQALHDILEKLAYIDEDGQDYLDALDSAMWPPTDLVNISAVFTQGQNIIYDTDSLNTLKQYLVVTAHYSDSSTSTITNYALSGSLTVGTSTITVSYMQKTTTFNVTVTENRYIPSQYTWLYDPRNDELFSNSGHVTKSTGGNGGTESLSDGKLILETSNTGTSGTSNFVRFTLDDETTTNGKLSCLANVSEGFLASSSDGVTSFRLQLSNGTTGAQAFIADNNGLISIIYYVGTTKHIENTSYSLDEYHVFELTLNSSGQSFSIDGEEIFSESTLANNYCIANAILNQAGKATANPNGTITSIDWIAYYEVA